MYLRTTVLLLLLSLLVACAAAGRPLDPAATGTRTDGHGASSASPAAPDKAYGAYYYYPWYTNTTRAPGTELSTGQTVRIVVSIGAGIFISTG
ncbi:hypothetical protein STCU_10513 [Strigomonas culicis]|uniref:Uncharacterized protein n=1 Tax=Strigomonas culicis TaxID=28005 RepID=S9TMQ2_9TRYP|nr:hypothetical protein STCU_10513 [Strigomonas culicis]|eukprot:EPY17608.1 hypothetical protein STCU_10513 [Strigomonas culicis]